MRPSDREAVNRILTNASKALGAFQGRIERLASPFDAFSDAVLEGDLEGQALYSNQILGRLQAFCWTSGVCSLSQWPTFFKRAFVNAGVGDRDWLTEPDEGRIEGSWMCWRIPSMLLERLATTPPEGVPKNCLICLPSQTCLAR